MAADILGDEGALGDHLYFLGAQILQYVVHQLGADTLPFVFFRDFGVCQDNESLGFDVFDDGDVVAQVEFVALSSAFSTSVCFLFSITLCFR